MNERYGNNPANKIDISIIIVNWNTKDLLKNCLSSIYQTIHDLTFEVIVVDNASSDGSTEMLEREFTSVIRIVNQENKGFGAANNQALAAMKGEYALLLNTDAVLTPDAVNKLWNFCEANDKAAIVCGQLLNADGTKQNSIASFPNLLTLSTNVSLLEYLFPRWYPSKRYKHTSPVEVDSAIGACMMIRKKALDEAGVIDERYFFFFEETDLAYTMRLKGWKIYQVPDAFIYHLQGQSIGHNINSRIEFYRSRYQFLKKWHNPLYYYLATGTIFLRLLANGFSNFIIVVLTLGLNKKLRYKLTMYSKLIYWHFQKN
ncbi:MAG: glycosyltransferase family 2 protein [Candidatus Margulisbacteria bacterium]|nr:glycosyltransferase family 2 protein [Candidatus Margulisiibacteriota bacterium]